MRKTLVLFLLLASTSILLAQKNRNKNITATSTTPVAKKALQHSDYDGWKSITERQLSNNGDWAVFGVNPQEGDGRLVIQGLKTSKYDTISRGAEAKVLSDASAVICKIKPQYQVVRNLKKQKKKKEDLPKDSLAVYAVGTGAVAKIPRVLSFKVPEKSADVWAYLQETLIRKDTTKPKAGVPKPKTPKKESEENGYALVIRHLQNNTEKIFGFVTEYEIPKYGKRVAFASTGNDSTLQAGVYVYDVATATLKNIFQGHNKHKIKQLVFDEQGENLAFVADLDTNAKTQLRLPKLLYYHWGDEKAIVLADERTNPAASKGWLPSIETTPKFSKDARKLFFGTNPKPILADTTLLAEDIVSVEVWSHHDQRLQPQQKATLEQDKKRSYWAICYLADKTMQQLGTLEVPDIQIVNEGNADFVLATSNVKYSHEHWNWNPKTDAYWIDTRSGKSTLIAERILGSVSVSPQGKYAYWYADGDSAWYAYNIAKATQTKLTDNRNVKFFDEQDDHPDYPNPYGTAGWSKNDEHLLIYDRYDLWKVSPLAPENAEKITGGRATNTVYRYIRLDTEERNIDLSKGLMLHTFNEKTRASGFTQWANGATTPLLTGHYAVQPQVVKAKNSNALLFTKSTFQQFPDLHATDLTFKNIRQISEANPQQAEYHWGSVELVSWKSLEGIDLEGLLFKPDDFDPNKKYPMISYFYERNSQNLHNYIPPVPSASTVNITYLVSNGYLVFVPDIVYKDGYPGMSAYNCIVPGVLSIVNKGYANPARLGIQGQSWGGYQTAFIITQSNLFRVAGAGAPVANMTSAYGGIRWGTGLSRQAQYERNQSRIGGTLWEKPKEYIENSPLFHLPKVQTPLLMTHNDADDAVPYYQGIEMYMALKRLGKPVWLLSYNGEKHNLTQRKNRKDLSIRLYQFFDHYLKDTPQPSWMADGLPMIEKGINQHYELKTNR